MLSEDKTQVVQAQAIADLLKILLPQAFTDDNTLNKLKADEWKLTKYSGRAMLSLIYFRHRGAKDGDNVRFYREFVDHFLRGSHSIDGAGLKMMENIAIGMTGGGGRGKIVKKPGWFSRHVTNRDWERKARDDRAEIAE